MTLNLTFDFDHPTWAQLYALVDLARANGIDPSDEVVIDYTQNGDAAGIVVDLAAGVTSATAPLAPATIAEVADVFDDVVANEGDARGKLAKIAELRAELGR